MSDVLLNRLLNWHVFLLIVLANAPTLIFISIFYPNCQANFCTWHIPPCTKNIMIIRILLCFQ